MAATEIIKPAPAMKLRPRCPNCNDRRKPYFLGGAFGEPRSWSGAYHGYGAFCTLRCAEQFANDIVRSNPGLVRFD